MKKKRGDYKTSESISNSNGSVRDHANSPPNDKYHNQSAPCSNLAAAIAQEIFPAVILSKADEVGGKSLIGQALDNTADNTDGGGDRTALGKKSRVENKKVENGSSTTQQKPQQEKQPLLGYMINRYLLEERIKARMEHANDGETKNIEDATSVKKKKSKKKKKKACAVTTANGQDKIIDADENNLEENDSRAVGITMVAPPMTLPSANGNLNSISVVGNSSEIILNKSLTTSCRLPSIDVDADSRSSLEKVDRIRNEKSSTTKQPGLDRLLDSLIDSAQPSSILDNDTTNRGGGRNIETFSAYLTQKFEAHLEQKQKKDKSKGVTSSPQGCRINPESGGVALKDVLPTISVKDVNDLLSMVDCRKCRTSATSRLRFFTSEDNFHTSAEGVEIELTTNMTKQPAIILNELSARIHFPSSIDSGRSKVKRSHLGLSIPISGIVSDDIEDAFSYMNMDDVDIETGYSDAQNDCNTPLSSFHLELRPIFSQSNVDRFLQLGTVSGKLGESDTPVQEYPMKTRDMINLVKHILLPCGLAEISFLEEEFKDTSQHSTLSADKLSGIANDTISLLSQTQAKIEVAMNMITEIDAIMEKADASNIRSAFDSLTPTLLREADKKCEIILKQLGNVLLQLFKATCFVGWSSTRGPNLLDFAHCVWNRYNAALESLVAPALQYRGRLLRASDRGRAVPQAFFSKESRDSLYELVKEKISTVRSFSQDFTNMLNGEEGSPSALIQILVLQSYRQHIEKPDVSVDNVFHDQESEELLQQIIDARISISQTPATVLLIGDIQKKVKEQRDGMEILCKKIRRVVVAMEDFAPATKLEFLTRGYARNESSYYDLVKFHDSLCNTDAGFEAKDSSCWLKISANLVMQWLILLCSRQCHESSMESLVLPSRLDKWLNCISGIDVHKMLPIDAKAKEECEGNGGERKIASIFAGLLYRWLEVQCSEWHAELTRDELLHSMDMEDPNAAREEGGKVGKKKPKRKSGGERKRRDKNEKNDVKDQSDTCSPDKNEMKNNIDSLGFADGKGKKQSIEGGPCIDDDLQKGHCIGIDQLSPMESIMSVSSSGVCETMWEYYPSVGIIDGQQFVAAEIYLVNRLQLIQENGPDSATPVFLE